MEFEGPQVFLETMDVSSVLQSMTIRVHLERYQNAYKWFTNHFDGKKIRILDLACGSGYGTNILSGIGETVGVDIDEKVLKYARKKYSNGKTKFIVGSGDDMEFLRNLGKFDAVTSFATIEHLDYHKRFLRWVKSVLHSEGLFVASFPSTFTMDWAVPHHKRDISRSQARQLFAETGFKIIKRYYQNDRVNLHHIIRDTNQMVVPPLRQWVKYYLKRPDHLIRRFYQITLGGGVLFAHQQYLLEPFMETI